MFKKIIILVLTLLLSLSLISCGNDSKVEENKLIVGFDCDFPPYGFVASDGSYDGFDLALAKEAAERIGYEFDCIAIDWNSKDMELKSGEINCIWNGFTMNGREEEYTFSDPYVDNSIVLIVKEDSGINSLDDMKGKVLMVQAGSSSLDAINDESNIDLKESLSDIVELSDYNLGFMELDQGTVDALAIDYGVAKYQIENREGSYVILDEAISTEQYAVGFLLGNTELRNLVNDALIEMAEDGTMLSIAKEYEQYGLSIDSLCMLD